MRLIGNIAAGLIIAVLIMAVMGLYFGVLVIPMTREVGAMVVVVVVIVLIATKSV